MLFFPLLVLLFMTCIQVTGGEEDYTVVGVKGSVVKVCQLVGDFDRERNQSTLSLTFTRYGVGGTDLGVSFEHGRKLIFLFGDTVGRSTLQLSGKDDSYAYTADENPDDGLSLVFYTDASGRFLPPIVQGVSQGPFEVPMEGIDVDGVAYAYFTTNHTNERTMGSSVLARFDDNSMTFTYLYTLSTDKFLNVQVVAVDNSCVRGLPESSGRGLLIWGSGEYRKSDPYLAYMPLKHIEDKSTVRYFKGLDGEGNPTWSDSEKDATTLFHDPIIGEFSVAWNPFLSRWIMLYDGVFMRSSPLPWGPWSSRQVLFDALKDGGLGHFIHWPGHDNVSDPFRQSTWGGPYGPYMIEKFTRGGDRRSTIYFTLSTWNPYTVVLMRAELQAKPMDEAITNEATIDRSTTIKSQTITPRTMSPAETTSTGTKGFTISTECVTTSPATTSAGEAKTTATKPPTSTLAGPAFPAAKSTMVITTVIIVASLAVGIGALRLLKKRPAKPS